LPRRRVLRTRAEHAGLGRYRRGEGEKREYWIPAATWRDVIFRDSADDALEAAKILCVAGLLKPLDHANLQVCAKIRGKVTKIYALRAVVVSFKVTAEAPRGHGGNGHARLRLLLREQHSCDHLRWQAFGLLANIVDEVHQDHSPVITGRIDTDDRVNVDIHHSSGTKQTVSASTDTEVDSLCSRIAFVGVEEMGPFGVGRIADEGKQVRLEARYPTAGAHKRHHLADDTLGLGHVDKDESHMGTVERCAR
jgi:hypothetical protein